MFPVPCKDICDIACQRGVMHFVDTGLAFNSGQSFDCIDHVHAVQPGNLPCLVEVMGRPHAECCPDIAMTALPAGIDHRGECVSVLNHFALEMVRITIHHLEACLCRVRGSIQYHPREQDIEAGYVFTFYRVTCLVDEIHDGRFSSADPVEIRACCHIPPFCHVPAGKGDPPVRNNDPVCDGVIEDLEVFARYLLAVTDDARYDESCKIAVVSHLLRDNICHPGCR